jgi:hypothetical protein
VVGVGQRVLMFKQLTYDQSSTNDLSKVIKRIEVHNQKGEIIVNRGENNRFEVEDHPTAVLVDELFAQLSNACGYTISMQRLENPVRLPDGSIDYSEYGLAPETRTEKNEDGTDKTDDKGNPIGDEEDGTTLQYGRFFVTRETISYYGYDPATLTPIEPVHPTVENDDLAYANGFAGDIVELP